MEEASVSLNGMTFVIRPNSWDRNVLRDVILLDEYGLKNWRDMLKLDCEGGEADIVAGLSRLGKLSEIEVIFGEWHGIERRDAVKSMLERTHGFKLVPDPLPPGVDLGRFFALRN